MALIVKKFGGSSVATPEKMRSIVHRVTSEMNPGDQIVIVVSAMGDTTDDLVSLANQITSKPYGREMDMLLSTGEQISIALLAMAFEEAGYPAISLTGPQAGIQTSDAYNKGLIEDIQPKRVLDQLRQGKIVVVAGFQGLTKSGDITTLGRGGSDTTAVALAGAMNADVCEIYTDVEGVYSADPRIVANAKKMMEITYGEMLEMAHLGAGVMQPRAVEMGSRFGVPIHVRSTFSKNEGTIIREEYTMEGKQYVIRGIAHDTNVAKIAVMNVSNEPGVAHRLFSAMAENNIDVDMIVQSVAQQSQERTDIIFTITRTDLPAAQGVLAQLKKDGIIEEVLIDEHMAKVSIVGAGMLGQPGIAASMFGVLGKCGVNIEIISTSEISISCLINENKVKESVNAIHEYFFGDK